MTDNDDIIQILFALLSNYNIPFDSKEFDGCKIYTVDMFGIKIIYIYAQEAIYDKKALNGWHVVYVYEDFNANESRDKILWGLGKVGYFHYLKMNYRNTFQRVLSSENLANKMIDKRLEIYKDTPKYNYIRELNNLYKNETPTFILSIDPGFYDYIIE